MFVNEPQTPRDKPSARSMMKRGYDARGAKNSGSRSITSINARTTVSNDIVMVLEDVPVGSRHTDGGRPGSSHRRFRSEEIVADHVPDRPRVETDVGARQQGEAVHQPDAGGAIVVLPFNVGLAIA